MLLELLNVTTICYLSRNSMYVRVNDGTLPSLSLQIPDFSLSLEPYRFRLHMINTDSVLSPAAAILETDHMIGASTHFFEAFNPSVALAENTLGTISTPIPVNNRLFSYSKLGHDVMLAEYTALENSLCSNVTDVLLVSGPCWFTCYPFVTVLRSVTGYRRVNLWTIRGHSVGVTKDSENPVVRDKKKNRYDGKEDEFLMQWYLYHLSETRSYIAITFYNPESRKYLTTSRRGRRYLFTSESEKKFRWNDIHRTKMADERFFIQEPVKGIRGNYVTFRSHENLDYYLASHGDKIVLSRTVKPGQRSAQMFFRVSPAPERTPSPQTTTRKPVFMIDPRFIRTVATFPPYIRGIP